MASIYNKNKSIISVITGITVLGLGIYSNSLCGVLGIAPIITVLIKNYSMSSLLMTKQKSKNSLNQIIV